MTLPQKIPNRALVASKIPAPDAPWSEIQGFALTFDGYEYWGSHEKCAEIANAHRQGTMTDLRTCLFFEQRRWRHFGEDPDNESMQYIRGLVEQIKARAKLANDLLS